MLLHLYNYNNYNINWNRKINIQNLERIVIEPGKCVAVLKRLGFELSVKNNNMQDNVQIPNVRG